jgi:malate dehydrogenase
MDSSANRRVATLAAHLGAIHRTPTAAHRPPGFTVAVLGAAGGIGQPLSLLLKRCPLVDELRLYDVVPLAAGVAADVSHVNSRARTRGFHGPDQLPHALSGCDLVVIPAGVPRKPGMTRDDLFKINAGIVRDLVSNCAKHCPDAILNVISNPVNSTVPIAAEVLRAAGVYDPKKLMGVTHLDVMRARTFVSDAKALDPTSIDVPVVGGHAGITILPLLSQCKPFPKGGFSAGECAALTDRIQNGGTEVVEAKAGAGSATLSMAAAAAEFAHAVLRGMAGERNVVEHAFVESTLVPGLPFFASKVKLGRSGVEKVVGLGKLSDAEKKGLQAMKSELGGSIRKGADFARAGTAVLTSPKPAARLAAPALGA